MSATPLTDEMAAQHASWPNTACLFARKLEIELNERREAMFEIVRILGHGCTGLSHTEVVEHVRQLKHNLDTLKESTFRARSNTSVD